MSSFSKVTLFVALLFVSYTSVNSGSFARPKHHVNITNKLGNGLDLTVHCKSKDDDLGERLLHQDESFSIVFHGSAFGTTLFHCSFEWSGQIHRFDIYDAVRDECRICNWSILQDGPCLAQTALNPPICYKYH